MPQHLHGPVIVKGRVAGTLVSEFREQQVLESGHRRGRWSDGELNDALRLRLGFIVRMCLAKVQPRQRR